MLPESYLQMMFCTVTNESSIKATPTSEFESRGRNGVGVKLIS